MKKSLFILPLLLFNLHMLNADSSNLEKELIVSLNQGVKTTEKFLEKVPTYQLYKYDKTILHYAVELEKYDIVEFLVSKNIELSRKGGVYYQTALQDAIFYQYFRIARLLINNGTPLDIQNIDGDTALHIAAKNGYSDMVNLLLSNGASKNIYNANGNTPYDVVPNFMMDSSKKLKSVLKLDKQEKLKSSNSIHGATFTLDGMEQGGATFTLDKMNFEGSAVDTPFVSESKSIEIQNESVVENSNMGSVVKSN
ncbi:ankyrin repeat domain-containing protein [Sulfurovum sp. bin170]|uniref:ankyrin repeat domain-containing protein n=1 Tax=Sulfurovum sp. bin170 TaxID=2695268 RepID=UPI0013DEEC82|nr:ankyrin repeat domain-containing protein [Sulfurovum sp. bin170]NEW61289.1 ankyrin repeat domain-containing protein [Sulfurovum sp. bin170]